MAAGLYTCTSCLIFYNNNVSKQTLLQTNNITNQKAGEERNGKERCKN